MYLRLFRAIAAAGSILAVASCAAPGGGTSDPGPAAPGPADGSLVVHRGDFERGVLLTGELEAAQAEALVVPRTPHWQVEVRWLAESGSPVGAGEKVIDLDNSAVASDLEDKEISLQEKLSELTSREAELDGQIREKEFAVETAGAELEKARIKAKVPEGIVPRQELEDRKLALDKARAGLEKAEADLAARRTSARADLEVLRIDIRKARREIDAAREAIDRLTLYAPKDGIFLVADHPWQRRPIQVGDSVWTGLTVGTIPDLSSLVVTARLPDVEEGAIAEGMPARVVLDAYPDETFEATVDEIAPVAQAEGPSSLRRHFRVRLRLARVEPERMIPGMSARVEVLAERRTGVLLAPRSALLAAPAASSAPGAARAVLAGGARAPVRLGPCNELECVVEDGLSEGTRLARRSPFEVPTEAAGPAGSGGETG